MSRRSDDRAATCGTPVGPGDHAGRGVQAERHVDDRGSLLLGRAVTGTGEGPQHPRVFRQYVRFEHPDTQVARGGRDPLEQQRAEPQALEPILDGEGHVCVRRFIL